MHNVTVYSSANRAFCSRAKSLLAGLNIEFEEIRIDTDEFDADATAMACFVEQTKGAHTVPQLLIDGTLGCQYYGSALS